MGKVDDFTSGRSAGMLLALQIVKEGGIEALEKEIRFRNVSGINLQVTAKELNKATELIKAQTIKTVILLAISVLHDRFGFGSKRCKEFFKWFDQRAENVMSDIVTWDDWSRTIKEELGIDIPVHLNDGTAKERRKYERDRKIRNSRRNL